LRRRASATTDSGANWLFLLATLTTPLQILIVDLLLSADNAVVTGQKLFSMVRSPTR
jgi:hypothetical protein